MSEQINEEKLSDMETDKFEFIREEIKARPLNRKKIMQNAAISGITAVAFGLIACLTFVGLLPIVTKMTENSTKKSNTTVSLNFPTETPEEEMSPADMLLSEETQIDYESFSALTVDEINQIISSRKFTVSDYQGVYTALGQIVAKANSTLVKVTATHEGTDWFNELIENTNTTSGLVVANNDANYYILTYYETIKSADSILITFDNGAQAEAELIKADIESGLCVVSVPVSKLNEITKSSISVASLGNSFSASLPGGIIIAIGAPAGNFGSINYGMVTSVTDKITVIDSFYRIVKTDIYGSKRANGFLVTVNGYVVGVIANGLTDDDSENLIAAYGITELKSLIENLSNNRDFKYLGVKCKDVPVEAYYTHDIPQGVFVESVEKDSPAMLEGIQPGDIISAIGNFTTPTMQSFSHAMGNVEAGQQIKLSFYRPVGDEYKEITVSLTLQSR